MTIPAKRRFDPMRFFQPKSVNLSGAGTRLGQGILANLHASPFSGTLGVGGEALENADLALVADDAADVPAALAAHAARGACGAIVFSEVEDLTEMAKSAGIRVLGPYSYGTMFTETGLNASRFGQVPPRGRIALVGQSASLARTVIDWAAANSVGFSHIIGIGGNADIGFGTVLDFLSRDAATAAILIEIDRLQNPRQFLTAARAAARLRPVIAIAPGVRLREADLNRASCVGATFSGCDLSAALLEGTDFTDADLRGSDLTALDPLMARLRGAVIDPAQAVSLVEALGLSVRAD